MMTNLFSSFDPCSSFYMFSMWMSTFILLAFLPSKWWLVNNRASIQMTNIMKILHLELKLLMGNTSRGTTIIFISLIIFIGFNNVMGLFPFIFTSTSHLVTALALATPLWVSFMLYGWINNTNHMFMHMVPMSTPTLLMPFMVLIETISNIIRSGTLTVRLSANMIAGHLLLTLLGNQTSHAANSSILMILLITQVMLLLLESAVAFIQAYVFTVLSTLYASEVINH